MLRLKRVFAALLLAGILSLSGSQALAGPGETPGKDCDPVTQVCSGRSETPESGEGVVESPKDILFGIIQFLATFVA